MQEDDDISVSVTIEPDWATTGWIVVATTSDGTRQTTRAFPTEAQAAEHAHRLTRRILESCPEADIEL